MLFEKNGSERKKLWIVSLDFGNGHESEEFVETSERNVIEKIKDLVDTRENMLDGDDKCKVMDYITVAEVRVVKVRTSYYYHNNNAIGMKRGHNMIFQKNKSEGKELWIVSLDFGDGMESEDFVETSEENAVEKVKNLTGVLDGDDTDPITIAKIKVIEVKYPIKTVTELK